MTHGPCGVVVTSIIAGYAHLLECPLAPPRVGPEPLRRPEPVEDRQLLGRNPRHRVEVDVVESALRRVE